MCYPFDGGVSVDALLTDEGPDIPEGQTVDVRTAETLDHLPHRFL